VRGLTLLVSSTTNSRSVSRSSLDSRLPRTGLTASELHTHAHTPWPDVRGVITRQQAPTHRAHGLRTAHHGLTSEGSGGDRSFDWTYAAEAR
jgi:hypothetical protein